MARIVAQMRTGKQPKPVIIPLNNSNGIYFLTGSCSKPIVTGKGLKANDFPAYIFKHSNEWVLYAGTNAHVRLNGHPLVLDRCVLKDGDELVVGESEPLLLRFLAQ